MELLASDVETIPTRNLRVPLREFLAVWIEAERRQEADRDLRWYDAGVVEVCRWLANATIRLTGGGFRMAVTPLTRRPATAYAELIEAECLAAERMLLRRPPHAWLTSMPGLVEGIADTLAWAWRHEGNPPLATASATRPAGLPR